MATYLPALTAESGFSRYLEEINRFPMLTGDEEYALATAWREENDVKAAHRLVTSHLRLVVKIAMGFRGYGLPVVELVSEGNIGLMQAVKKFEPKKGFRLSTYAMWWIKASIQEYILRSWSLVKLGTTAAQKKLFFNLRRLKNKIEEKHEGGLRADEIASIAHELEVTEQEVTEMDQRMGGDYSLNYAMSNDSDDGAEWIDYLEDETQNHEARIVQQSDYDYKKRLLYKAMDNLNEREKNILEARQLAEEPQTLDDLSKIYNISRERVRQIEARALEKLQEAVAQ